MLDAAVVVVNYRTEERVVALLEHLEGLGPERPASTVVVDNSPRGGLADRLGGHADGFALVPAERNLGFAGGVNRALSRCRERVVILLNPDAWPEPGCLEGLVREVGAPDVWVAGPALRPVRAGDPAQPSATRRDPGILTSLVEHTVMHRLLPRGWLAERYFLSPLPVGPGGSARDGGQDCAMVQGACMAIRREAFERIGRFDEERFFLYWEETDFCRRVRAAGGLVRYCPALVCGHEGGASSVDPEAARRHFWRGFYAYHRKHGGALRAGLLWPLLVAGVAAEWLVLSVLDLLRRGRDARLRADRVELGARLRTQLALVRSTRTP